MASEDKRNFKRYRKDSNFALKFKDRLYNATLVDYSFDGIGVIVRDRDIPQMEKGDVVRFRVDKPRFDTFGEVMWSDRDNSVVRAGLRNVGVLKGQLNDFRLSDVMIGLQRGRKTGILTVECGDIVKKIYIKNGDMIFSSSNQDKDRLGDLLLRNNIITRKQLDDSVTELKKTGKRQGFILVYNRKKRRIGVRQVAFFM